MGCRVAILYTFIFHLSSRATNKVGWVLFYALILIAYLVAVVGYIVFTSNGSFYNYRKIRQITIYNEAFGIFLLLLYVIYIYFYLVKMKNSI